MTWLLNPAVWLMINIDLSAVCSSATSPQRPTAKELLKHKFITRYTKKTAYLTELIDRYRRWKSEGHGEESSSDDSDMWVWGVHIVQSNDEPISCRIFKHFFGLPKRFITQAHGLSAWSSNPAYIINYKKKGYLLTLLNFLSVKIRQILTFPLLSFQGCWWWCGHMSHVDLSHS